MTVYNLSKMHRETILVCAKIYDDDSNPSRKLWSANWLAWYRMFYRWHDKDGMKRNIKFFLEEVKNITKEERV